MLSKILSLVLSVCMLITSAPLGSVVEEVDRIFDGISQKIADSVDGFVEALGQEKDDKANETVSDNSSSETLKTDEEDFVVTEQAMDTWDGTRATPTVYDGELFYDSKMGGYVPRAGSTYYIYTAEELAWVSWAVASGDGDYKNKFIDSTVVLMNDIDLSGAEWIPIGGRKSWADTSENYSADYLFRGIFDGNGHIIKGLNINTANRYAGLFGVTGKNAIIKNIGIVDPDIYTTYKTSENHYAAGALIGRADGTDIDHCFVRGGRVRATQMESLAGLIGATNDSECNITYCYAQGTEVSNSLSSDAARAAGILGFSGNDDIIKYCYSNATCTLTGSNAEDDVGAIVGQISSSYHTKITHCYATKTTNSKADSIVGGDTFSRAYFYNENGTKLTVNNSQYNMVGADDLKNYGHPGTNSQSYLNIAGREYYYDHATIKNGGYPVFYYDFSFKELNDLINEIDGKEYIRWSNYDRIVQNYSNLVNNLKNSLSNAKAFISAATVNTTTTQANTHIAAINTAIADINAKTSIIAAPGELSTVTGTVNVYAEHTCTSETSDARIGYTFNLRGLHTISSKYVDLRWKAYDGSTLLNDTENKDDEKTFDNGNSLTGTYYYDMNSSNQIGASTGVTSIRGITYSFMLTNTDTCRLKVGANNTNFFNYSGSKENMDNAYTVCNDSTDAVVWGKYDSETFDSMKDPAESAFSSSPTVTYTVYSRGEGSDADVYHYMTYKINYVGVDSSFLWNLYTKENSTAVNRLAYADYYSSINSAAWNNYLSAYKNAETVLRGGVPQATIDAALDKLITAIKGLETKIVYNINGGSGSVPNPQTVKIYSDVTSGNSGASYYYNTATLATTPVPTKTGYAFLGWATTKDDASTITTTLDLSNYATKVAEVYAVWQTVSCKVTFEPNGGTCDKISMTVTYQGTYGDLPVPTWSGHTFNGWYTAPSGGTKIISTSTVTNNNDHTLYAQWTENKHVVLFDTNDGNNVNLFTVEPNDKTTPKGIEYSYDPSTGIITLNGSVSAEETIFNLTFNFDAASIGEYSISDEVVGGKVYNGALVVDIRDSAGKAYYHNINKTNGWISRTATTTPNTLRFWGWRDTSGALTFENYQVKIKIEKSATATAYTPPGMYVTEGSEYGTLPEPTRVGYNFVGWYTAPSGGNEVAAGETVSITSEQTLYAHWEKKSITVAYNLIEGALSGGGYTAANETVQYGMPVDLPTADNVTRNGYTFSGWNANLPDANGKTFFAVGTDGAVPDYIVPDYIVSDSTPKVVTFTASWNANDITYTLHHNNKTLEPTVTTFAGKCDSEITDINSKFAEPDDSEMTGYTFVGWFIKDGTGYKLYAGADLDENPPLDSKFPAEDVVLYAGWSMDALSNAIASYESKVKPDVGKTGVYLDGTVKPILEENYETNAKNAYEAATEAYGAEGMLYDYSNLADVNKVTDNLEFIVENIEYTRGDYSEIEDYQKKYNELINGTHTFVYKGVTYYNVSSKYFTDASFTAFADSLKVDDNIPLKNQADINKKAGEIKAAYDALVLAGADLSAFRPIIEEAIKLNSPPDTPESDLPKYDDLSELIAYFEKLSYVEEETEGSKYYNGWGATYFKLIKDQLAEVKDLTAVEQSKVTAALAKITPRPTLKPADFSALNTSMVNLLIYSPANGGEAQTLPLPYMVAVQQLINLMNNSPYKVYDQNYVASAQFALMDILRAQQSQDPVYTYKNDQDYVDDLINALGDLLKNPIFVEYQVIFHMNDDTGAIFDTKTTIGKNGCFTDLKDLAPDGDPERKGFIFKGWYTTDKPVEGGEDVIIDFTAINKIIGPATLNLYARWEKEVPEYTLSVTAVDSYVTVYLNEEQVGSSSQEVQYLNEKVEYGTKVILNAASVGGNRQFMYWKDNRNRIVSYDYELKFTLEADRYLEAVYSDDNDLGFYAVTFVDSIIQTIISEQHIDTNSNQPVEVPKDYDQVVHGDYVFSHWSMKFDKVDRNMIVEAIFVLKSEKMFTITVNGGISSKPQYKYNEAVTVTAEEQEGKVFAYWKLEDGTIVSYDSTYKFFAYKDMTLTAVYDEQVELKATIVLDATTKIGPTVIVQDKEVATFDVSFMVTRTVPDEYTFVSSGLLLTQSQPIGNEDDLTLEAHSDEEIQAQHKIVLYRTVHTANDGQYKLTTRTYTDKTFYARGFVVYLTDKGEIKTQYTDVLIVTYTNNQTD